MPSELSLYPATVCDDIRKEDNGKYILVGIYSGDIYPLEFPARLPLSYWVPLVATKEELKSEFSLSIKPTGGGKEQVLLKVEINLSTKPDSLGRETFIPIRGLTVNAPSEATLTLKGRLVGGRWKTISTKRILPVPPTESSR